MKTVATLLLLISLMSSLAHGRLSEGSADLSSVKEEMESGVARPTNVPKLNLTDDRSVTNDFIKSVFGDDSKSLSSPVRKAESAATAN